MLKISKKHSSKLMVFWIALFMSTFMSFVITAMNVGLGPHFLSIWLRAWGISFLVGLPAASVAAPLARKLVELETQ